MVSPTGAACTDLISHTTQPTSPQCRISTLTRFGVEIPKPVTSQATPCDITLILSPRRKVPFLIRTKATTPK